MNQQLALHHIVFIRFECVVLAYRFSVCQLLIYCHVILVPRALLEVSFKPLRGSFAFSFSAPNSSLSFF